MCGWTQGADVTLNWFREQPASNDLSGIIGPDIDHTYGNASGYYVTTRVSFPITTIQDIDVSALVSPRIPDNPTGPTCVDWWYMMHGTDNTEFNVNLVPNENFTAQRSYWRRSGDQGLHWQHAQLQLDPSMAITRVIYEAVAIFSVRSEVSIDDLTLLDGPCIKPDFYSIACTFEEEHICGYSADPTGQFSWSRRNGATPTAVTGASTGENMIVS
jgi:hypothetical protein